MADNYLFVYGTLRRACQHALFKVLDNQAEFVAEATFQGILYLLDNYPGVIESSESIDIVYGELYYLNDVNLVLSALDDYEECSLAFPAPTEYRRCKRLVKLNNQQIIEAWIYLYNRPISNLPRIKSGDFLDLSCL